MVKWISSNPRIIRTNPFIRITLFLKIRDSRVTSACSTASNKIAPDSIADFKSFVTPLKLVLDPTSLHVPTDLLNEWNAVLDSLAKF